MLSREVIEAIDQSVLCWLATISEDGFPNVSPKEAFVHDCQGKILVANIASPISVRNIEKNDRVCVSFVNVFLQKGFKVKGRAIILKPSNPGYEDRLRKLTDAIGATYPIISIIEIQPIKIDPIVAPSYRLFPDSGPADRIREALTTYKVDEYKSLAE